MQTSRTRNFIAGLLTGYTVNLASIVVGLWLTPFILRFLSSAEYGINALASDILMWLLIADLGISPALNVQVAQQTGSPDRDQLNRLASTTFFTQLGMAGVLAVVGVVLVYFFPTFFHVQPDLQSQVTHFMGLLILGSVIALGTRTFSAILVAYQQIHVDNLIRLALIAIRTLLIITLLLCGWKLLSLAVASLAAIIITSGLSIIRCYRAVPELSLKVRLTSWKTLGKLGNLGFWFTLGGIGIFMVSTLDSTLAARLISLEAVTTLYLTGRVYFLFRNMLSRLSDTARPAMGQLIGQGKLPDALINSQHLFTVSAGGATVIALSLFAGNGRFVPWWVGNVHYGGWLLDMGLACNLIVHNWVTPMHTILTAGLIVRPQTICYFVEGVLNLILSIILTLHFGLIGVVFSTFIARLLTSCLYLPWLVSKIFKQNYRLFLFNNLRSIVPILLILIPVACLARLMGEHFKGLLSFMLPMAVTATIGCILLWIIAFDRILRLRFYNILVGWKSYSNKA